MFKFRPAMNSDLKAISEIYNSNRTFLKAHLKVTSINLKWLEAEKEIMKIPIVMSVKAYVLI